MDQKNKEYSQDNGNLQIIETKSPNKKTNLFIGTLNVLTKEHKVLGRSKKMRWFTNTVFIAIVAIVLFLFVSYSIRTYNIGKNIFLEARALNEKISSGNLEVFELNYKNDNRETIYNVNITFELPPNFVLDSISPKNIFDKNTNTIWLGDLASGANGKIKLSGFVLGEVGSQQFIKFSLNYLKDALHRNVRNVLFYSIEDSVLDFKFSLPKDLYQDVLFSSQISLYNQGRRELKNIKIIFDKNIRIQKADNFKGLSFDANNIYLDSLEKNEKVYLNLDLIVKNVQGLSKFILESEANGLRQNKLELESFVEVPKFKISIVPYQKRMRVGEYLDFGINYQNNENSSINNISLNLKPSSNFMIKDIKLENPANFRKDGHIIYFKNSLDSNESGNFNIKVLLNRNKIVVNQKTGLLANINYSYQGKTISYPNYSAKVRLCSSLNVESAGYYYSPQGDQLGIGPIPPIVDIPTNYWIFWKVDNFGNNLSSFSMSADLPESLVWTNNKSVLAGNLQYGEVSRRVIWNIDQIDAQNGKYEAKFEIGLIPEEKDVGQVLDLLKNIKFSANDDFCESKISGIKENIDTNLKDDNLISNKGKVQKFK